MAESIQIKKSKKAYGIVQESLLENSLLSPTARLLAAWLAIRPHGWIVWRADVLKKLGIGEQAYLSARKQLIKSGYLVVNGQRRVLNGKFSNVELAFVEDPEDSINKSTDNIFTAPCLSGHGVTGIKEGNVNNQHDITSSNNLSVPCLPGHGLPGHGQAGRLTLTTQTLTTQTLTKQPPPQQPKNVVVVDNLNKLIWPDAIGEFEKNSTLQIFSRKAFDLDRCQLILDELSGTLEVRTVKNPVGWVRKLSAEDSPLFEHAGRVSAKRANAAARANLSVVKVEKSADEIAKEKLIAEQIQEKNRAARRERR